MATVQLYSHVDEVAGQNIVDGDDRVFPYGTAGDTLTLPDSSKVPVNYQFRIGNYSSGTLTLAAKATDTLNGVTSLTTGQIVTVQKTSALNWRAYAGPA